MPLPESIPESIKKKKKKLDSPQKIYQVYNP